MRFLFSTFPCVCVFLMFAMSRVVAAASETKLYQHADNVVALLHVYRRASGEPAFHNDSRFSRKQILKMGLENFLDAYTHGRRRWQLEEEAYPIYTRYKEQDNKRRIGRLHQNSRRQMTLLYVQLGNWEGDAFLLRYNYYSHGTAVRAISSRWPAEYEEFIGRLLDRVIHSGAYGTRQQTSKRSMSAIDRLLRCYRQKHEDEIEKRADFRNTLKTFIPDTAKVGSVPHLP